MGQNSDGKTTRCVEAMLLRQMALDLAKQPTFTPWSHLFCWPCLHQWLHAQSPFSECPVCKGKVLEVKIFLVYGRGGEEGIPLPTLTYCHPGHKQTEGRA